jgi:hypothetical protein
MSAARADEEEVAFTFERLPFDAVHKQVDASLYTMHRSAGEF